MHCAGSYVAPIRALVASAETAWMFCVQTKPVKACAHDVLTSVGVRAGGLHGTRRTRRGWRRQRSRRDPVVTYDTTATAKARTRCKFGYLQRTLLCERPHHTDAAARLSIVHAVR